MNYYMKTQYLKFDFNFYEEAGNMGVKRFKIFTVNNDQCLIGKG